MLEFGILCLFGSMNKFQEFSGQLVLRYSLRWIFLVIFEQAIDVFERHKCEHPQVLPDILIRRSQEVAIEVERARHRVIEPDRVSSTLSKFLTRRCGEKWNSKTHGLAGCMCSFSNVKI